MSPYRKSWLFVGWSMFLTFTFPIWLDILGEWFGIAGYVVGIAFLLSHGVVAICWFSCPRCRRSIFMRSGWINPHYNIIPKKTCDNCGRDLTEQTAEQA